MSDFTKGITSHSRAFLREPVNVALLVVLPLVAIELYSQAFGTFHAQQLDASLAAGGDGPSAETLGYITGAVFATATLAGVLGLFQVLSARAADHRLGICGVATRTLLGSRLVTILGITLLISVTSLVWLSLITDVSDLFVAFGALVVAGVVYALLGVLVGSILPRELEGSLVLIVLADLDNVFAAGVVDSDSTIASLLPLHYPHELFQTAVVGGSIDSAHAIYACGYAAVLFALALVAYRRAAGGANV